MSSDDTAATQAPRPALAPLPATQATGRAQEEPSPGTSLIVHPRQRGARRRMTRTFRPVYPIRALWEAASEDERRLAQERCTAILEYWLGVTSKEESAKRLNVPTIRLWQLSQRA